VIPTAFMRSRASVLVGVLVLLATLAWSTWHTIRVATNIGTAGSTFIVVWLVVFAVWAAHMVLAWTGRPFRATPSQERNVLDRLKVAVLVPAYNEDPAVLTLSLRSMFEQSRRPQVIRVVDDGSRVDLSQVRDAFDAMAREYPDVDARWIRQENAGKRHAQIAALATAGDVDVYVTVDSDTILDRNCLRESLKPLVHRDVMSVAGISATYNVGNAVTRVIDPWLMSFQYVLRSAHSRLGNVMVNSGVYALYRAEVVRDALDGYANETFLGRTVMFSDDSLLTLYAKLKGRTVQQETAVAFTYMPEKISHHLRQQLRWMRGSTIRSVWRFRYLNPKSWGYAINFLNWFNFVLVTIAFGYFAIYMPVVHGQFITSMLVAMAAFCYLNALRYAVFGRSDRSLGYTLGTVALAPVMAVWAALVLRPLRLYAMATCWKTGWGTRQEVEVTAGVDTRGDDEAIPESGAMWHELDADEVVEARS
jgi:hyaluronan synthase